MDEPTYTFHGTADDRELARLRLLERVHDPKSHEWLSAIGLGPGWTCLEVGAGAGSTARWMSARVGTEGRVVAVDLDIRFLTRGRPLANLRILEGDVRDAELEARPFDLIHARYVLIHDPDASAALDAMLRALKTGGWLVLEEPDFSVARGFSEDAELQSAFENVAQAVQSMLHESGKDPAFGSRLPAILQTLRLTDVAVDHEASIAIGGSDAAEVMRLSARQLRDQYLATGLVDESGLEQYERFTRDPACRAIYYATVRARGRKA